MIRLIGGPLHGALIPDIADGYAAPVRDDRDRPTYAWYRFRRGARGRRWGSFRCLAPVSQQLIREMTR